MCRTSGKISIGDCLTAFKFGQIKLIKNRLKKQGENENVEDAKIRKNNILERQ